LKKLLPALAALLVSAAPSRNPGRELLQKMHDRYAGKWYHTLTFVQQNTLTHVDGSTEHSVWKEYAAIPGRLRIDFQPGDSGNGVMFANDSQYTFAHDSLREAAAFVHPLMVLGFDVYAQPVERTAAQLAGLKINLTVSHNDIWHGRPILVIGARDGDLRSRQFWVDKERLVFVRMMQPARDSTRTSDVRFEDYRPVGPAWVSARVEFLTDGQQRWLEEYHDIKTDVALPDALFDPRRWKESRIP
jgi:hypothetical protein